MTAATELVTWMLGKQEQAAEDHAEQAADRLAAGYLNVGAFLDDGLPEPPTPTICRRRDGVGLFYSGHYNVLIGDPESGKTLVTDFATVEVLDAGGKVLRVDLDHNGPESTLSRLLDFGANENLLRSEYRFAYVEPEGFAQLEAIKRHCVKWRPDLVIVDSIGELLPIMGAASDSSDDFTRAHRRFLKPIADTGAAVVGIDHLSKGFDSRKFGATGTVAKKRAVSGASIRVTVDSPFSPDRGGSAFLAINKDRHGGLRKHSPTGDKEPLAGKFVILGGEAFITAPLAGEQNPGEKADPADIQAVANLDPPPTSARDARERLKWRDDRARRTFKAWNSQQTTEVGIDL